jgi:hypothetical protein
MDWALALAPFAHQAFLWRFCQTSRCQEPSSICSAFGRRRGSPRTFPTDVRLAARNACLGLIIGDIVAAPTVEQGLLFYVLAGVACAEPERDTEELSIGSRGLTGAGA